MISEIEHFPSLPYPLYLYCNTEVETGKNFLTGKRTFLSESKQK